MIESIGITNFKSLKDVSITTKNLNLFAGLNGMGKSSLIQSLLLIKQSFPSNINNIDDLILNGDLIKIGKGQDALYQFASDENLSFSFKLEKSERIDLEYKYDPSRDRLKSLRNNIFPPIIPKEGIRGIKEPPAFKDFQYICAERLGPIPVHAMSSSSVEVGNLGIKGEYTVHYLHIYGNKLKVDKVLKHEKTEDLTLINQVNAWMGEISPGVKINVIEVPHIDQVLVNYQFEMNQGRTASFTPQNVGFGLSYVLPIVVSLLTSCKDKIIIIENPESHIHPRGQAELGKLMALAADNGAQLFIETHSDHIINGIRVAVKEKLIDKNRINICYFDKETTKDEQYTIITELKIDEQGELSDYPDNFLDEWNNQLLRLI
jgi:predicted ATPase